MNTMTGPQKRNELTRHLLRLEIYMSSTPALARYSQILTGHTLKRTAENSFKRVLEVDGKRPEPGRSSRPDYWSPLHWTTLPT